MVRCLLISPTRLRPAPPSRNLVFACQRDREDRRARPAVSPAMLQIRWQDDDGLRSNHYLVGDPPSISASSGAGTRSCWAVRYRTGACLSIHSAPEMVLCLYRPGRTDLCSWHRGVIRRRA